MALEWAASTHCLLFVFGLWAIVHRVAQCDRHRRKIIRVTGENRSR